MGEFNQFELRNLLPEDNRHGLLIDQAQVGVGGKTVFHEAELLDDELS